MIIYTVNYHDTFFLKLDLTIILIIPTYDAIQQIQLDIKTNDLSFHYNLGGATIWHIRLLMTDAKYATLSNVLYVHTKHHGILLIPKNATRVASYELKCVYNKNLQVFHKVRGVY